MQIKFLVEMISKASSVPKQPFAGVPMNNWSEKVPVKYPQFNSTDNN